MSDVEQRFVFDEVAALYDRARPSYPEPLIADVLEFAELGPDDRILEVGCGTGQATRLFARHGHRMTCLEPGPGMAALARTNLDSYPNVEVLETTFEDWPLEEEVFALLISAQAFHWVRPEIRFVKAARALAKGGAIALFWNMPAVGNDHVHLAIQDQYARHAPSLGVMLPGQRPFPWGPPPDEDIRASGLFGTVSQAHYAWQATYDADTYVELMLTQSNHRLLPVQQREVLVEGIRDAIATNGGHITVDYKTDLYFARRR